MSAECLLFHMLEAIWPGQGSFLQIPLLLCSKGGYALNTECVCLHIYSSEIYVIFIAQVSGMV